MLFLSKGIEYLKEHDTIKLNELIDQVFNYTSNSKKIKDSLSLSNAYSRVVIISLVIVNHQDTLKEEFLITELSLTLPLYLIKFSV